MFSIIFSEILLLAASSFSESTEMKNFGSSPFSSMFLLGLAIASIPFNEGRVVKGGDWSLSFDSCEKRRSLKISVKFTHNFLKCETLTLRIEVLFYL